MENKFLVFDIWSDYAHFKKPYTTTSPLTFSIPTRTVISGMIAAILGIGKGKYHSFFIREDSKIAVSIIKPIKKVRISENLINTKKSMNVIHERTQIKIELLKDPCYRIYISLRDYEFYNKLKTLLEKHSSVYTLTMGLSENLANFQFVGEYDAVEVDGSSEHLNIRSVVPIGDLKRGDIDFSKEGEYFTETIPMIMNSERFVSEYGEVLFERTCKSIYAKAKEALHISILDENIVLI